LGIEEREQDKGKVEIPGTPESFLAILADFGIASN
jgi:hypothetical protein